MGVVSAVLLVHELQHEQLLLPGINSIALQHATL
jgi:hypothetical protein